MQLLENPPNKRMRWFTLCMQAAHPGLGCDGHVVIPLALPSMLYHGQKLHWPPLLRLCTQVSFGQASQMPTNMHAGFEHLHSFAFLGRSGRIATASDGIFSYVPAGPNKQIDMFLHAYDLRKAGRLKVRLVVLMHWPDQDSAAMSHVTECMSFAFLLGKYMVIKPCIPECT